MSDLESPKRKESTPKQRTSKECEIVPYCIDCEREYGFRKPLPDSWIKEKRCVREGNVIYALCHAHSNRRLRNKTLNAPG